MMDVGKNFFLNPSMCILKHSQGPVAEADRRTLLIVKEDCWIVPSPGC